MGVNNVTNRTVSNFELLCDLLHGQSLKIESEHRLAHGGIDHPSAIVLRSHPILTQDARDSRWLAFELLCKLFDCDCVIVLIESHNLKVFRVIHSKCPLWALKRGGL